MDHEKIVKTTEYLMEQKFRAKPMEIYKVVGKDRYEKIFERFYRSVKKNGNWH